MVDFTYLKRFDCAAQMGSHMFLAQQLKQAFVARIVWIVKVGHRSLTPESNGI